MIPIFSTKWQENIYILNWNQNNPGFQFAHCDETRNIKFIVLVELIFHHG
jgi:hypothetical protein